MIVLIATGLLAIVLVTVITLRMMYLKRKYSCEAYLRISDVIKGKGNPGKIRAKRNRPLVIETRTAIIEAMRNGITKSNCFRGDKVRVLMHKLDADVEHSIEDTDLYAEYCRAYEKALPRFLAKSRKERGSKRVITFYCPTTLEKAYDGHCPTALEKAYDGAESIRKKLDPEIVKMVNEEFEGYHVDGSAGYIPGSRGKMRWLHSL